MHNTQPDSLLMSVTVVMIAVGRGGACHRRRRVRAQYRDRSARVAGLAARLSDVASLELERAGLDLTFVRAGNDWLVGTKGKLSRPTPARSAASCSALADMTFVEPKTRSPTLYPRLEVEDPGKGKSTLVTIKDQAGADIAAADHRQAPLRSAWRGQ